MSTLRIGILSTADIARRKVVPGMGKASRVEVVAIASRDPGRARRVAAELGIPNAHESYESLLADPLVDAVYIPLPNNLHAHWTMAAARAGKHVLCEKPLAMTSADAQQMVDVCHAERVRLMEAFMYRLHPSWVAARELLAGGRIGQLTAIQSWFSYHNDDPANIRNIRAAGGGALYDIGCYQVNLSRMLFESEPTRIEASVIRDPQTGVDVVTSAVLEFGDRVSAFTSSIRAEDDQQVHVYGTRGRLSIAIPFNIPPDRPTQVVITAGGDPPVAPASEVLTFGTADPYAVETERFAEAILDDLPTPVPPEDAVANLRVMERIFEVGERR